MKSTKLTVAVSVVFALCFSRGAQAQDPDAPYRKAFAELLTKQLQSLNKKDIEGYYRTLTPDCFAVLADGRRLDAKAARPQFTAFMRYVRGINANFRVDDVMVRDNQAWASIASGSSWVIWSPVLRRDIVLQVQATETYSFRRVNGQWLESSVRDNKSTYILDGQPVTYRLYGR